MLLFVNKYKKTATPGESVAKIMDETNAYYSEEILSNKHTLEKLVETEPALKDKILSFFKGASADYADVPKLSGAAKKYYRTYKKLFDEFSARNAQSNATDAKLDSELSSMMRMEKAVNSAVAAENGVPVSDIPQNNVLEPITNENGSKKLQNPVFDNVKPRVDNTADSAHLSTLFAKNAQKTPLTNINQENMHVSGRDYAFAGISAKTADRMKLSTAEQMLKDGADSETIRKETGWFKGYDGKWRFEIDDSDLKVATNGKYSRNPMIKRYAELVEKVYFDFTATAKEQSELKDLDQKLKDVSLEPEYLGDMIKHPILFEAYPQLQGVKIAFIRGIDGNKASYHPGFNEIAISQNLRLEPEKLKKVLIHEIQHAIQELEGFASGSNVDMFNNTAEKTAYEQYYNTAGEIEARDAEKRLNLTGEQRKNNRPDADRTDVVFAGDSQISYFTKGEYDAEKAGVHDQIRNSQEKLNAMEVVFSAKTPYKVGKAYEAGTWAIGELKKYGFQADRQGFGKIYFQEDNIRDAMKYLDTDAEKVSIVAIYKVLKQGIQIGEHGNHKQRGKHTVTFGAPVEINGKRGNMAVVVNMRNNEYKVYRILMPDGSIFKFDEIKNNAEREMQRGVPNRSLANATSSASIDSISRPEQKSNTSSEKSSENSSGKDYALDIDDDSDITGAEVMSWMKKPESDGKLDLEATVARGLPYNKGKSNLTVGELRKVIANSTKEKVYSKADALKVVNRLSGTWGLTQRARDEIADTIWQFLNDAPDIEHRQDMAHDIAQYIVAKVLVDSKTENPTAIEAAERLAYLRTGIGKLSLN